MADVPDQLSISSVFYWTMKALGGLSVAIGGLAGFFVRGTLKRVDKAEEDLKDHKRVIYSKLDKQDKKLDRQDTLLAKAVSKLADTHTLMTVCKANHIGLDKQFESMAKLSEEQYSHTREVLTSVAEELKDLKREVAKKF